MISDELARSQKPIPIISNYTPTILIVHTEITLSNNSMPTNHKSASKNKKKKLIRKRKQNRKVTDKLTDADVTTIVIDDSNDSFE